MTPRNELKNLTNELVIKEFERYKTDIAPIKPKSRKTQVGRIRVFSNSVNNKPFSAITENDILEHLKDFKPSSRNGVLTTIKSFYRWFYDLESNDRLPNCVRRIKPVKIKKDDIEYRERVVTDSEYQKLIDIAFSPMHKAMLETMWEYGVRANELLSINSDGVTYDGTITRITVKTSKTETRDVVHKGRLNFLMTYVESYQPFKDKKDKPLFVGYKNKRYTIDGLEQFIRSLCNKLGLKNITPHDFRHTSISRDRKNGVPLTHIETKHGLVHGSQVMKIYDHNKTKDYEDYLKGKKEETPETYDTLKKEKEQLQQEKNQEITKLKSEVETLKEMVQNLSSYLSKETKQVKTINDFESFRK